MALSDWRRAEIERISSGTLDVLVIGGGINGAGIIRDLALRARFQRREMRLALVDRGHFSSGTSGRNSQLIHGGLRYLKNLEFKLVAEALSERAILLKTAPHLVKPLAFVIPLRDLFNALLYGTGLFLYDFLAGNSKIEPHRYLSTGALHRTEPKMRRFFSGARFFDCRVNSARLVLLNIREAVTNGAMAANYLQVESFEKRPDGLWHIELQDDLTGERFQARSKALVNASGAWSREGNLRLVRGSHLIFPRIGNSENAISYFGDDGRIVFFIPWGRRHRFTLVGTTDVDHRTGPDLVRISPEEVQYLLRVVEEVFPGTGPHEPMCAYSSLRPLVRDESSSATKTSREHRIWADDRGIVHVAGGKYTTYRLMSEEACDLVASTHFPEWKAEHHTALEAVAGNEPDRIQALSADASDLANKYHVDELDVRDLIGDYGVDAPLILESMPELPPEGLTRLESAQIAFAAGYEWAEHLTDLMFISTYWGYERRWTAEMLAPFASALGSHKNWNPERLRSEIDRMLEFCDQPRVAPVPEPASVA